MRFSFTSWRRSILASGPRPLRYSPGSAWAILLAATGTFEQLLTYVVFTGWLFYALGAASIFIYRRNEPHGALPYRVPGYPWTPLLFIDRHQSLPTDEIQDHPDAPQRLQHFLIVTLAAHRSSLPTIPWSLQPTSPAHHDCVTPCVRTTGCSRSVL